MSAESELRDVLVAHAPLAAAVPAQRISIDTVGAETPRPFIVLSKESETPDWGLDNTLLDTVTTLSVQVIGTSRQNAIAVRELVQAALLVEGVPWTGVAGGYDPEADLEAEVITLDWIT